MSEQKRIPILGALRTIGTVVGVGRAAVSGLRYATRHRRRVKAFRRLHAELAADPPPERFGVEADVSHDADGVRYIYIQAPADPAQSPKSE